MSELIETLAGWRRDAASIKSSYRRLATARLPVNLWSAQAHVQRRAATLLHGLADGSSSWEELDGRQFVEDKRGDRASLLLGGTAGGVALPSFGKGLIASAGTGTLYLTNIEKLSPAAQRVLRSIIESGRYTPVGDPFPRPVACHIITATSKPLAVLTRSFQVDWKLADLLGYIELRAEAVLDALETEEFIETHPRSFAAAS